MKSQISNRKWNWLGKRYFCWLINMNFGLFLSIKPTTITSSTAPNMFSKTTKTWKSVWKSRTPKASNSKTVLWTAAIKFTTTLQTWACSLYWFKPESVTRLLTTMYSNWPTLRGWFFLKSKLRLSWIWPLLILLINWLRNRKSTMSLCRWCCWMATVWLICSWLILIR